MLKKMTTLFLIGGLASAAPVKPSALIDFSAATKQAACDAGYAKGENPSVGNDGFMKHVYGVATGVNLQLPGGSVFSFCSGAAKALRAKSVPTENVLLIQVSGTTKGSPSDTKDWATALVINDAQGKELGRLSPDTEEEGGSGWKPDCKTDPCTWSGSNSYLFGLKTEIPEAFLKIVNDPNAASLMLLISRGNGVERLIVDSAQAGKPLF